MMFSIITITRNNSKGLQATAKSIQKQTSKNYEWIIIDGASTDETSKLLKDINADQIISEPDNGIYDAMNRGIELSSNKYLIFMNAGDRFYSPKTISIIKEKILQANYEPNLIYGDSKEIHQNGQITDKKSRSHIYVNLGMFTHHQAIIYNKASLKKFQYNMKYKIAADYDLTLRLLQNNKEHHLYINKPICLFEKGGISQQQANIGRWEQFLIRKENKSCNIITNIIIYSAQFIRWHLKKFSFINSTTRK